MIGNSPINPLNQNPDVQATEKVEAINKDGGYQTSEHNSSGSYTYRDYNAKGELVNTRIVTSSVGGSHPHGASLYTSTPNESPKPVEEVKPIESGKGYFLEVTPEGLGKDILSAPNVNAKTNYELNQQTKNEFFTEQSSQNIMQTGEQQKKQFESNLLSGYDVSKQIAPSSVSLKESMTPEQQDKAIAELSSPNLIDLNKISQSIETLREQGMNAQRNSLTEAGLLSAYAGAKFLEGGVKSVEVFSPVTFEGQAQIPIVTPTYKFGEYLVSGKYIGDVISNPIGTLAGFAGASVVLGSTVGEKAFEFETKPVIDIMKANPFNSREIRTSTMEELPNLHTNIEQKAQFYGKYGEVRGNTPFQLTELSNPLKQSSLFGGESKGKGFTSPVEVFQEQQGRQAKISDLQYRSESEKAQARLKFNEIAKPLEGNTPFQLTELSNPLKQSSLFGGESKGKGFTSPVEVFQEQQGRQAKISDLQYRSESEKAQARLKFNEIAKPLEGNTPFQLTESAKGQRNLVGNEPKIVEKIEESSLRTDEQKSIQYAIPKTKTIIDINKDLGITKQGTITDIRGDVAKDITPKTETTTSSTSKGIQLRLPESKNKLTILDLRESNGEIVVTKVAEIEGLGKPSKPYSSNGIIEIKKVNIEKSTSEEPLISLTKEKAINKPNIVESKSEGRTLKYETQTSSQEGRTLASNTFSDLSNKQGRNYKFNIDVNEEVIGRTIYNTEPLSRLELGNAELPKFESSVKPSLKTFPILAIGSSSRLGNIGVQGSSFKNVQSSELSVGLKSMQEQTPLLRNKLRLELSQQQEQQQQSKVGQEQSSDLITLQVVEPITIQETAQKTELEQLTKTTPITTIDTNFKQPPRPNIFNQQEPESKKKKHRYVTKVRRKGIFQNVGVSESVDKAIRLGEKILKSSAAASFKVESDEERFSVPIPQGFIRSKRDQNVIVQPRNKRISSFGEKMDITYKGIQAQRRKGNKMRLL